MSYKCLECGHIFEDGEQRSITERSYIGEGIWKTDRWSGCPVCLGSYAETKPCKECGSEQLPDDLYGGLCLECLTERITYDNVLEYLMETQTFVYFMFEYVFHSGSPDFISDSLRDTMRELYLRRKANDLLCDRTDFLQTLRNYILDGDGEIGRQDFGEWLTGRKG